MSETRTLGRLGVIVAAGLLTVGLAALPEYTGAGNGNGNGHGGGNDNDDNGGVDHVVICHVPPGNPDNKHTITVGKRAVAAHRKNHGDALGPCEATTSTTTSTTTPTTTTSTTTPTTSTTSTTSTTTTSTTTSTTSTTSTTLP